jgi:phage recombination protein Bet
MSTSTSEAPGALALRDEQTTWSREQLAALRQIGIEDAPNADLAIFLHQAKRTGLDPFARQLYMVGRWDNKTHSKKWTIQASIDGLRLVAHRVADRLREPIGYEDTLWCGPDGIWRDVWLSDEPPAAAKVCVLRDGQRFPSTARWSSYVQTTREGETTRMWKRMPDLMIAKCAEALALRKGFPQDLSGIYTDDEMGQASNGSNGEAQPRRLRAVSGSRTPRTTAKQEAAPESDGQQADPPPEQAAAEEPAPEVDREAQKIADAAVYAESTENLRESCYEPARAAKQLRSKVADPEGGGIKPLYDVIQRVKAELVKKAEQAEANDG